VRKTINHFFSFHTEPDQQHLSHKKYINSDFKSRKISALECMKEFHLGDEKKIKPENQRKKLLE